MDKQTAQKHNDVSVALSYSIGDTAPVILASGRGEIARAIKKIAMEHHIKIVQDIDLADILVEQEIGSCIPEESYEAIAAIFAFLQSEKFTSLLK